MAFAVLTTERKAAAVVVDENPIGASLWGHDRSITLPLDALARVDLIEDNRLATDRLLYLRRLALDTMRALPNGPLSRDAFEAAGFTAMSAREAHGLEWRTRIDVELKLGMSKAERHEAWPQPVSTPTSAGAQPALST